MKDTEFYSFSYHHAQGSRGSGAEGRPRLRAAPGSGLGVMLWRPGPSGSRPARTEQATRSDCWSQLGIFGLVDWESRRVDWQRDRRALFRGSMMIIGDITNKLVQELRSRLVIS